MRSLALWADKLHDREGVKQPVYALVFRPDGTQLIATSGNRVVVYETADGELISSLKGHKDTVYCLAYSRDGKMFASGGADKMVILWSSELEGFLKYAHNDSIQCLAFNPVNNNLASCTATEFGIWNAELKVVTKHKVSVKITACCWTNDGLYLALGLANGCVSIRNKNGEEKVLINRPGGAPVWAMQWNPSKVEATDVLAVCDWNQKLSFYLLSGRPARKEKDLGFTPCSCSYFSNGEYMVVAGSDRKASLYTREGVFLTTICEQESWIWTAAVRPKQNYVAIACHDGTIALYQLIFSTVHGLYRDRYAYRKDMTDVVIQDLSNESETRIRCREMVRKIAIYKDRLAVQLPNQINVYDLFLDENNDQKCRLKSKIKKKIECNLLVVCMQHVVLCQERRLLCLTFDGEKEREWVMESLIRYIKVIGGPHGREGLLVGMKNGQILKIFLDNAFAIELIKQQTPVRCLDLSASRNKLAVVDDNNTCLVYDLTTKELLYQEPHANSVAWNTQHEDTLCFSGNGMLHIKSANHAVHTQKLQGFVVGFNGPHIYCLLVYAMTAVEVPQSHSMYQYLQRGMFRAAYEIACLGVTETDWRALGSAALEYLDLGVAKNAYVRVRDLRSLELIHVVEDRMKSGQYNSELAKADILAYQGKFEEAAVLYTKNAQSSRAVDLFCDLQMFDRAKEYLQPGDSEAAKRLRKRQAESCRDAKDPSIAIDILLAAGEEMQAVDVMGEHGLHQRLIDLARRLNKAEVELLQRIAMWLRKLDQVALAAETLQKLQDPKALVDLYVASRRWSDAFAVAERHPECKQDIYLPYAQWLAENDDFEAAQDAFRKAGMQGRAGEVLEVLTHNAVVESRFLDAAYYYWQLSVGCMQAITAAAAAEAAEHHVDVSVEPPEDLLRRLAHLQSLSDIYYSYNAIHRFLEDPFTAHTNDALFNIARFLYSTLQKNAETPLNVSRVAVLYALAKQGRNLGAFKVARHAFDKLQSLKLPVVFREHIDLGAITIRAKPFTDKDELLPHCFRCSASNPLLIAPGAACISCKQPFVFSAHSYDLLPLVEFVLETDIADDEAVALIKNDSAVASRGGANEGKRGNAQVLSLDGGGGDTNSGDAFLAQLQESNPGSSTLEPIRVDRETLRLVPSSEVFVQKWPKPLTNRYFRNVLPEVQIAHCEACNKFFHADEFELLALQRNACPFCRTPKDAAAAEERQARLNLGPQHSASSTA
eukprot:m.32361 g.32361  ORF g.32361 m.32361 type:complete len:1222 (-) comp9388_c0_seq1:284-3949(-)